MFEDASGNVASWLMSDTAVIGGGLLGTLAVTAHLI